MNKIAIITGGSRGLGRNMAQHLAEKGYDLIVTYHQRKDKAEELVAEIERKGRKAAALPLDVATQETLPSFVAEVAQLLKKKWNRSDFDILINNAGIGMYAPLAETSEEQFDLLMNIHVKSPFFLTQKLLPIMKDGGRIVNISSGLARFSFPGYGAYAAMKGAIEVFTRYLAKELGPRKISAITIAPGAIETDFGGGVVRDNKEINAQIAGSTALGRVGLPDDIGQAVAMLVSDECSWINGQRIEISGGIFL